MRARHAVWIAFAMLVAPLARADDVRCSLTRQALVIAVGGQTATIELACEQPYAVVRKGNYAFVACGSEGVAIYDLHQPLQPFFHGRFLYDHPCVDLNADGQCLDSDEALVVNVDRPSQRSIRTDPKLRDAGIALVAIGGATVVIGLAVLVGQAFADLTASFANCLLGCATGSHGPPAEIGWAGLATSLVGVGVALAGIPVWVSGARGHVTTYATFGGAGIRVAF